MSGYYRYVAPPHSRHSSVAIKMSEQEVHPNVAQRIIIKFLTNEGVRPAEILRRLQAQFTETCLSQAQVYDWHKKFSEGRVEVENKPHARRPRTSVTVDNIEAVRNILEDDRRLTIIEIADFVGISFGSAQSIITVELGFRKVSARWVPRLLTDQQKQYRMEICQRLLQRFQREGDDFLKHIVTCDETWVHHYTPESKQASKEWRRKGEGAPIKAKTRLSAGKVLATVFWDFKGVLLVDFLHERRTVNSEYYCQLLNQAKLAYRQKRRRFPIRDVILLHDNARPHTANLTRETLEEIHWTTLEHPPYSPDLSPCDYHMFGPLKESLGGERFDNDNAVEVFVRNWLETRPSSFYDDGIKKLPVRWEKCVSKSGDYVEK